jgi:hypothetical protein
LLVDKFVRNDIDINELKNELLKRLFFNLNSDKANLYDIIMRDLDLLID